MRTFRRSCIHLVIVVVAGGCASTDKTPHDARQKLATSPSWWLRQAAKEVPLPDPHHAGADWAVLYRAGRMGDDATVNGVIARQVAAGPPVFGVLIREMYDIADRERATLWLQVGDDRRASEALKQVSPKARDILLAEAAKNVSDPARAAKLASRMENPAWRGRALRSMIGGSDNRPDDIKWVLAFEPVIPPEDRNFVLAARMAPTLARAGKADAARKSLERAEAALRNGETPDAESEAAPGTLDASGSPEKPFPRDVHREKFFLTRAHAAMAETYLRLDDDVAYRRHLDALKRVIVAAGQDRVHLVVKGFVARQGEAGDVAGALAMADFAKAHEQSNACYFHEGIIGALAKAGEFQRAEAVAKAAGCPDTEEVRQVLVVQYARRGQVERALALAPQFVAPRSQMASVIASLAVENGHHNAALRVLPEIDEPATQVRLLQQISDARVTAGDVQAARDALRAAINPLKQKPVQQRFVSVSEVFERFVQLDDLAGAEQAAALAQWPAPFHAKLSILYARKDNDPARRASLARAEAALQQTKAAERWSQVQSLAFLAAARQVGGDRAGFDAMMRQAIQLIAENETLRLGADNSWISIATAHKEAGLLDELANQLPQLNRSDRVALGIAVTDLLAARIGIDH